MKNSTRFLGLMTLAFAPLASFATGTALDVSSVTDTISAQSTSVTGIGLAVLGVIVLVAAIKWARRAL